MCMVWNYMWLAYYKASLHKNYEYRTSIRQAKQTSTYELQGSMDC
jgi:hypothetical protein